MQEHLQEFVDSQGQQIRVDAARGVLRGVKLLGLASRNARTYREAALREAAAMYEGAKVNVNHPNGSPLAPRDYRDRLGAVRQVEFRPGEGLFADLHFNPKHALAEQLVWDAEHAPEQVGLSHNVLARTKREGETTVVEAITQVESVDLVADPATTRGLFEAAGGPTQLLEKLTLDQLTQARSDLLQSIREPLESQLQEAQRQIAKLNRQVRIAELLTAHGLPMPGAHDSQSVTTSAFIETLQAAADERALEALVADRAALARQSADRQHAAKSREQRWLGDHAGSVASPKEFAASLRR